MRIFTLTETSLIQADIHEVWDFFSKPENLNELTPSDIQFEILPDQNLTKMYAGMIIHYKISPFSGIKFRWTTEITHCKEQTYFVDEQRFGPYSLWHHQHHFVKQGDHVLMTDIVNYALPMGVFGRIAQALFIRKKLNGIFSYRKKRIDEIFK